MSKKSDTSALLEADPTSNPFREFRDNELLPEYWGLGPLCMRPAGKGGAKKEAQPKGVKSVEKGEVPEVLPWVDPEVQPLPRSARRHLHGWRTPEELAAERWNISDVVIFEEPNLKGGKLDIQDVQIAHAQILLRSSFCRDVLCCCYVLENADNMLVEHQSDYFNFVLGPEGWHARYHIYSPGLKPGGNVQHKPVLNNNGCYLVRLFHMGTWRCVWVSDQVPVDANDAPLLPFSPLSAVIKDKSPAHNPQCVQLWPLLLCKALLKIAAPDMEADDQDSAEDESLPYFSAMHALTGAMVVPFFALTSQEVMWAHLLKEVPQFSWDDDDQTVTTGTAKTKSTKKTTKEASTTRPSSKKGSPGVALLKRGTITTVTLRDTKSLPAYYLPGICPGHRMSLTVNIMRDIPLKKPLPEPEVPVWKTFRWVDWARRHGLYEAYYCPRTKLVKLAGLLKLSYAPNLLDVMSGDSITYDFRVENAAAPPGTATATTTTSKKHQKKAPPVTRALSPIIPKEEMRDWVLYEPMYDITDAVHFTYFSSSYDHASAFKVLPTRPEDPRAKSAKGAVMQVHKQTDMRSPGASPLYLQVDSPEFMRLRISLSTVHPKILLHNNVPKKEQVNKGYAVLEEFEWFEDCDVPYPKCFIETRGYDAIEVGLTPGRHFFRLWVVCRLNWHVAVLSDATVLMGGRSHVLAAANIECPWVSTFLTGLGTAFISWIRTPKTTAVSLTQSLSSEREFVECYKPDLPWDQAVAGYPQKYIHWMFTNALQTVLKRELSPLDYLSACEIFRRYFRDPEFGLGEKSPVQRPYREIIVIDPCDCVVPEFEEEAISKLTEEDQHADDEELTTPPRVVSIKDGQSEAVDSRTMLNILTLADPPAKSQVCEAAKDPLSCPLLKSERDKFVRKHEAATRLQAWWRGHFARRCLQSTAGFTPEVLKVVMEATFGNVDSLSHLMNELFRKFPSIKHAYSISSGLNGGNMLVQNTGVTKYSAGSKWLPFFQGTYYAHMSVKVHFDLTSNIKNTTFAIYDNDTGLQIPQSYNTHKTFHFVPNKLGYTVMGHGILYYSAPSSSDAVWTLSVLSSTANAFHICDNEFYCRIGAITSTEKFRMEEIYLPNRRSILGGVQLTVTRSETICFRAAATNPHLEMLAVLWQVEKEGPPKEVGHCQGIGELYWPYLRLEPAETQWVPRSSTISKLGVMSTRSFRLKQRSSTSNLRGHTKSTTKLLKEPKEVRTYLIEVTAPKGWPLSLEQWKRVDEVRNAPSLEEKKASPPKKKEDKKPATAREKERERDRSINSSKFTIFHYNIQPGDAYAEIECATPRNGGVTCKKDESRDMALYHAIKSWTEFTPIAPLGQNISRDHMGSSYRKAFRDENLEFSPLHPTESRLNTAVNDTEEIERSFTFTQWEGESMEAQEEDSKYYLMPPKLRDRFQNLYYMPLILKDFGDERVLMTSDRAEAAKNERQARAIAALNRMDECDVYNDKVVLSRQRRRGRLIETLYVDSQLRPEIIDAYNERDEVIAKEIMNILSLTRGKGKDEKSKGSKEEKKGKGKGKQKNLV